LYSIFVITEYVKAPFAERTFPLGQKRRKRRSYLWFNERGAG